MQNDKGIACLILMTTQGVWYDFIAMETKGCLLEAELPPLLKFCMLLAIGCLYTPQKHSPLQMGL